MLNAGVVDQDVDAAELGSGVFHHGLDVGGLAHIRTVVADLDAGCLAGIQYLGAWCFDIAKAVEHDIGTLACQSDCDT